MKKNFDTFTNSFFKKASGTQMQRNRIILCLNGTHEFQKNQYSVMCAVLTGTKEVLSEDVFENSKVCRLMKYYV